MKKSSNEELLAAAKPGNQEKVKELLNDATIVHAENEWAPSSRVLMRYMLEQRADISAGDEHVLGYAAEYGHLDVVRYLLEQGADSHTENQWALLLAVSDSHLDAVRPLVEHGVDIHARNELALCYAAKNGHVQIAKYLMEMGADWDKVEKSEERSRDIDKTTMVKLSAFAISLREQKELKELDIAAPESRALSAFPRSLSEKRKFEKPDATAPAINLRSKNKHI